MGDWNGEIAQLESIFSRVNCAGGGGVRNKTAMICWSQRNRMSRDCVDRRPVATHLPLASTKCRSEVEEDFMHQLDNIAAKYSV